MSLSRISRPLITLSLGAALAAGSASPAAAHHVAPDVQVGVGLFGTVEIIGSAGNDRIDVVGTGVPGQFEVIGLDGTTVNGAGAVLVDAGRASLRIDLGPGDDHVEFADLRLHHSLNLRLGDGEDVARFTSVIVRGNVSVRGGFGDDRVSAGGDCRFRRLLRLRTESGSDQVNLADTVLRGRLRIDTGDGDDEIRLASLYEDGRASRVFSGYGDDEVRIEHGSYDSRMQLYTQAGNDFVHIDDAHFDGDFDLDAGRGDDEVVIRNAHFDDDVHLYAGRSGWDRLDLDACRFEARVWHVGAYGRGPWLWIAAWSVELGDGRN